MGSFATSCLASVGISHTYFTHIVYRYTCTQNSNTHNNIYSHTNKCSKIIFKKIKSNKREEYDQSSLCVLHECQNEAPNFVQLIYTSKKWIKNENERIGRPRKHCQAVKKKDKAMTMFLLRHQENGRHTLPQEKPDALPKICQSQSATPTNADTHDHSHTLGD